MAIPRLQGRKAIVTGSSSGLGRAIALAYAKEGAAVMCADLQPEARADTGKEYPIPTHELIIKQGGKARFVKTNVTDEEQVKALIKNTVEEFGRLDM